MQVNVEQLLHGYRRGHEQLAGSTKLPVRDADLVTRLSDLSGTLSASSDISSYLTAYPLPTAPYYAVARTWPDRKAPRAGCVLTHTLLVPVIAWRSIADPRCFNDLFAAPAEQSNEAGYSCTLPIPTGTAAIYPNFSPTTREAVFTFVQRYFGDAKRPIVWFGQAQPEDVLWALLRSLWPNLRGSFSACTNSLQPRTLEDRTFDLMFAPTDAYPRFLKIPAENYVDGTSSRPTTTRTLDEWCRAFAAQLLSPTLAAAQPDADLWEELDNDPSSIRRLFLIESLRKTSAPAPQAAVGAMDLVESLARTPKSAVRSKQRVAEEAVRVAANATDPADGLECLRLIEDRLRRPAYSVITDTIGPRITSAVCAYVEKSLELTINSAASIAESDGFVDSWFGRGLFHGLRTIATAEPNALIVLTSVPALSERVLAADPPLANAYVHALIAGRSEYRVREQLRAWLGSIRDAVSLRTLRSALLPALGADDSDLLAVLLRGIDAEEVTSTFDVLSTKADVLRATNILAVVNEHIAQVFPVETRNWVTTANLWNGAIAQLLASAYSTSRVGLLELLNNTAIPIDHRADALVRFLTRLGQGRFPFWVRDVAHENGELLSTLVRSTVEDEESLGRMIDKLLTEVPDIPVAHFPNMLPDVTACAGKPFFSQLLDVTMHDLVPGYVSGTVQEEQAKPFLDSAEVADWIERIEGGELKLLVTRDTWANKVYWGNAWRFMAIAPVAFYRRNQVVLPELIEGLTRSHYADWDKPLSELWADIIRRSRSECKSHRANLILCVQALKFAFTNTRLPLSAPVAESFFLVYSAVTNSASLPPETSPLFGLFDWDKGKELRRELVDSFFFSEWPPGDLVLAVSDSRLLRKIFKRLTDKSGGRRYAQAALADLSTRSHPRATELATALRGMLQSPDFYEDWD